jgi:hypothetical protein
MPEPGGRLETNVDFHRLARCGLKDRRIPHLGLPSEKPLDQAEGEGFEPSTDGTAGNGFRDRRIRPLCHPSADVTG